MLLELGLSATLLVTIPGIGKVGWPFARKPTLAPSAADSLPPPWRTASRLALENQFIWSDLRPKAGDLNGGRLVVQDPRRLHVMVDPDSGTLATWAEMGEVRVGAASRMGLSEYGQSLMSRNFQRLWADRSRQNLNSLGVASASAGGTTQGGIRIPLGRLPGVAERVLGPGGPSINVYGSENIRISGTSNWTNQQVGPLGQKRSLFPSLDMQQDLDIRLEGQLSDRIRVNLLQNSANQIPLANRIAINYKGDEDALFQAIDLGNTNLSLPGTQYVSYSGKNEGLFGMKATMRVGPLDVTALASKQEGRSERASYAGGASIQTQRILDGDYQRGVYYFLNDPNEGSYEIDDASVHVYLDDDIAANNLNVTRGMALPDPRFLEIALSPVDSASLGTGPVAVRGYFEELKGGDLWDFMPSLYGTGFRGIKMNRPVTGKQRLAVTFRRRPMNTAGQGEGPFEDVGGFGIVDRDGDSSFVMKLLAVPRELIGMDDPTKPTQSFYNDSSALFPVRELELKNVYQLSGSGIDRSTFQLTIQHGKDDPPITTLTSQEGVSIPYIEVLGLDNLDETTGSPVYGAHDGRVDGVAPNTVARAFLDELTGMLYLPDPRPFAPRIGPGGKPFDKAVDSLLISRREELVGLPPSANEANPKIYDKFLPDIQNDALYLINVVYNARQSRGEINLGRGNILEGSDVVTINGQTLQRGRDYDVDYDLGRITLKRNLGPTDNLNIDYSYAPLFQQAGRTLLGSAFRWEGREKSFGGAFLYESRGAQEIRPRLGEEPSRTIIGDLNTDWTFRPSWMTRMTDLLPGVRTTVPSELRVQAEVGASFPNPNTSNEVFIDDMEGVRDAVSLSMDITRWKWSGVPAESLGVPVHYMRFRNAETHWYSPYSVVKERDLKPTLTDPQGAQNNRPALAISVPKRPEANPGTSPLWVGLQTVLDPQGLDISRSQFIELWVNDFNDFHDPLNPAPRIRGRNVKMHIDIGTMSEDQMRSPDVPPNGLLDTEDINDDNQLDVSEGRNEDTGLDGRENPEGGVEVDLETADGTDTQGDDYDKPDDTYEEIDARRWLRSNGTEGNKELTPFPDTEDLNLNGSPDQSERYFEYVIDLGDQNHPYLATDVRLAYGVSDSLNGWRRYRIPIDDEARRRVGTPDLTNVPHVRIWFDGIVDPNPDPTTLGDPKTHPQRPLLMLSGFDIVGSRWRAEALDTTQILLGSTLTLNSVNTTDNADIYRPPFNPGSVRSGNQSLDRREQSLALEFTRLAAGTSVEAFKSFSLDEDYSRYGKLSWYVTGFDVADSLGTITNDGLYYFVRFASDEQQRNYYEYRAPLPVGAGARDLAWQNVELALTELSSIKLDPRFPIRGDTLFAVPRAPGSADTLIVKGRPSFTRLRRISTGLLNKSASSFGRGQLWFDELRGLDIAKDRGTAQRVHVSGRLANLLNYNLGWNGRNADFMSVGETRGAGSSLNSLSFSGTFDLHRFFEGTGILLPVSFNFSQNNSQPRFSAGDDIVRGEEDQRRSETFSDTRGWMVSYSRAWSERSNPLLRHTLGGFSGSFSSQNGHGHNPSNSDQMQIYSTAINYQIAPRSLLAMPIPLMRSRFYPLPERFYANYRSDERSQVTADRVLGTDTFIPRSSVGGRAASVAMGADTRPFDFLHHHIEGLRNLNLEYRPFGDVNVGRFVTWNQSMDATFATNRGSWLRPQLSWNARYGQNNGPELSPDLSVREIQNGQQATLRWELPFSDLLKATPPTAAAPPPTDTTQRQRAPRRTRSPLWRDLLSRLGRVSTDFGAARTSRYSRLTGMPDWMYVFGLSDDPGVDDPDDPTDVYRMQPAAGNQSAKGLDWHGRASTTFRLLYGSTVQASGEFRSRTTNTNTAERGNDDLRFPDLSVEYGNMASALRLDKLIRNPRLRTAFNRTQSVDYANGRGRKTGVATSFQFMPLIRLDGEVAGGTRMELGIEHRNTRRQVLQLGESTQRDNNTDIDFKLSRSYSQGQKISFLGRESTVRSSVAMSLNTVFSRQTGGIDQLLTNGLTETRNPVERDRLQVNLNGSYGFSSNVSGNAILGFTQDKDRRRDIVTRTVRLEVSARFTF